MNFDIQRFAREATDITYRGRRRWSGNFGRVWIDNSLIFEIVSFEANLTPDREDVIIGQSKDSKIVSLTGEGTIVIKKVFNRGFNSYVENLKAGHDVRCKIIAALNDPDMLNSGEERIEIENVWFNEVDLLHFAKGEVVETEIPFGFTPEDVKYSNTVELSNTSATTNAAASV